MTIYILNDEYTDKVLKLLKAIHCVRGIEQDIIIFNDENNVLEYCADNTVHVVIFGEEAGEYTGYEFAYRLRMIDKNILPIIIRQEPFINEKAGEAELFGCITHKNMETKLYELIGYAAKRVQQPERYLLSYHWNNQERSIDLNNILYFRSRHRVIEIFGLSGVEGIFYKTLDETETELQEQSVNFLRISKSYLVNPQHILKKNKQQVTLVNGEHILVTRKYGKNIED